MNRTCFIGWTAAFAIVVSGIILSTGCVGYKLGTTLPVEYRAIYVPTFANETGEPALAGTTTGACVREFQKDGTARIVGADAAGAILRVTLADYRLKPLRYRDAEQAKTTREYRLYLTARLVLENAETGTPILQKTVSGDADFEIAGDLSAAKRRALPDAAEDLAHDIVESVVELW